MAITAFIDTVQIPTYVLRDPAQSISWSGTFYLNGSAQPKFAWIFQAPKAGNLEYVEYLIGSVSGANPIRVSFQGVDASGNPDGGVDQYTILSTPVTGWHADHLTSDGTSGGTTRTVTVGEWVACVVEWSGTQSGGYEPNALSLNGNPQLIGGIYPLSFSGGAWTRPAMGTYSNFAVRYTSGLVYPLLGPCVPLSSISTLAYHSGSTPDERGLKFTIPIGVRVTGVWVAAIVGNAADVVLYDADGTTVLATSTIDPDYQSGTAGFRVFQILWTSPVTLLAATAYRLTVKPTTGSNITTYAMTVDSAALLGAHPGGTAFHSTARTDAGAWTDTTTQRAVMGLLVDAVDAAGSSGGGGSYAFVG